METIQERGIIEITASLRCSPTHPQNMGKYLNTGDTIFGKVVRWRIRSPVLLSNQECALKKGYKFWGDLSEE